LKSTTVRKLADRAQIRSRHILDSGVFRWELVAVEIPSMT